MNNYLRAGILLITLAIPVFIWLFLKSFGQNQFDLPVYYADQVPTVNECDSLTSPHTIPQFTSMATDGKIFSRDDLTSQIAVSYILPPACEERCEEVLEQLANLQNVFASQSDFQIIVFGGENYSPADLKSLEEQYLANPKVWKFVSVNSNMLSQLEDCGFLLGATDVVHAIILTDEQGRIRGYYEGIDEEDVDRLKGELKILFYILETASYD